MINFWSRRTDPNPQNNLKRISTGFKTGFSPVLWMGNIDDRGRGMSTQAFEKNNDRIGFRKAMMDDIGENPLR
jgi:hypothetical protein